MSTTLLNRAEILIQQKRYDEAQKVLGDLLTREPNNIRILALMSEVRLHQDQPIEAERLINSAISFSPSTDYLYFIKSRVMTHLEKYDEAEDCLKQATTLNPIEADYFAFWGSIKLVRKQFPDALELADKSLQLDAENLLALNIRSSALLKLNHKDEAFKTIEGALREDPNNPYTHANYGWNLLEKGNSKKALEHFREALKNDPTNRMAQAGMIEALKSRYFLYKLFLKYSFWISNLTSKYQWGVIIGFYLGFKGIRTLARNNPSLEPYLTPLILLLALIAFSTWIITPISNLFLRLNVYGKHLLSKKEKISSNFVGISAAIFLLGLIPLFALGDERWVAVSFFGFAMMVPFSAMFSPTKQKYILVIYTAGMFLIGLMALFVVFETGNLLNGFSTIFLVGLFVFQWVANFMMIKQGNV